MTKPLILVDGSSYFYRAFHALPPLTNSKGQPTGAIYGVVNMIKRLIKDYKPTHMAVVFDAKGSTFRHDLYPQYKATRAATPPDLSSQFEPLIAILKALGLPLLIIQGIEADDVIGTLAAEATEAKIPVIISTGDKDMAQLVNQHIELINTMSNQHLTIEGVKEKFGVYPHQIIDYLALMGDSVDNVPGVPKCGPKTAVKWLDEYQSLEQLMANADAISGKIGENLRATLDYLPLAKTLVTIKTDVDLPLSVHELAIEAPNTQDLIPLVKEYEFKTWLKELLSQEEAIIPTSSLSRFTLIESDEALQTMLQALANQPLLSFITVTNERNIMQSELQGIALAIDTEQAYYLPFLPFAFDGLKSILENPKIEKLSKDSKQDRIVFNRHGITLEGLVFDTMLESYVLNSGSNKHDLDSLSLKYLGEKLEPQADLTAFACQKATTLLKVHKAIYPLLDEKLREVLHSIELPLVQVLAAVEQKGVLIDTDILAQHGERLKKRIQVLMQEAEQLAGRKFNLNSPKQLQTLLFEELKIPVISKTPKGQPSTAESVLQELAFDYPLPAIILEFRGLSKLVSTYIDALPKCVHPTTKRVHTCYNQAVAVTGRLSSSEPNLQNIPIRSEEGRLIRKAFIAPPKHQLIAADYSQIELRIMAHLSKDANLLSAFADKLDIHTATASEIFNVPLDKVQSEHRRRAKAINFGLIYGMSAFGLAKQLGIERKDAEIYMDIYFKRYPGVQQYMENTRKMAHETGFVETLFGRRLYLPEINTKNLGRQKAAERMAINAPMQGSAADIIKKAMLAVYAWKSVDNPMIMQVHDELVLEAPDALVEEYTENLRQLMENAVTLLVPLEVSITVGEHWGT